jgi:hypothetical protein
LANFHAKSPYKILDKPWFCMYNAKPLYHGLTDMGHIWYKDTMVWDIGFDRYDGLMVFHYDPASKSAPYSTILHFTPL